MWTELVSIQSYPTVKTVQSSKPAYIMYRVTIRVIPEKTPATHLAYFCFSPPMNRVATAPMSGMTISRGSMRDSMLTHIPPRIMAMTTNSAASTETPSRMTAV